MDRGSGTTVTNIVYIIYFLCQCKIVAAPSPVRVYRCGVIQKFNFVSQLPCTFPDPRLQQGVSVRV